MYKLLDLFSGIGGFSYAAHTLGIAETAKFVEKDSFCQKVLAKNFPNVPIHDDVTTFTASEGDFDIISFGSPCFPAGTMILTDQGFCSIEKIKKGMKVLTHLNRWQPVVQLMRSHKNLVIVETSYGNIVTTEEHPFYTLKRERLDFTPVKDLKQDDILVLGKMPLNSKNRITPLVAQYLGFLLRQNSKSCSFIWERMNEREQDIIKEIAIVLNVGDDELPFELLSAPLSIQHTFLDTFFLNYCNFYGSKKICLGLSYLIQNYPKYHHKLFEENDEYKIEIVCKLHPTTIPNNYNYVKIKRVFRTTESASVFNIGVAIDESYTVEGGYVAHNCQDLSQAGKQDGIHGDRSGLFFDAVRIVSEIQPFGFIMENVMGITKWQREVIKALEEIGGYNLYWFNISLKQFGGCHERKRWFCVGWRSEFTDGYFRAEKSQRNSGRISREQSTSLQEAKQGRYSSSILDRGCDLLPRIDASNSEGARGDEGGISQYDPGGQWEVFEGQQHHGNSFRGDSIRCDSLRGSEKGEDAPDSSFFRNEEITDRGSSTIDTNGGEVFSQRSSEQGGSSLAHPHCQSPQLEKYRGSGQGGESPDSLEPAMVRQGDGAVGSEGGGTGNNSFAHSESQRSIGTRPKDLQGGAINSSSPSDKPDGEEKEVITSVCGGDDGLSARLDSNLAFLIGQLLTPQEAYTHIQEGTASDTDDIPHRNKRIKALGNAVTPAQASIPLLILYQIISGKFL